MKENQSLSIDEIKTQMASLDSLLKEAEKSEATLAGRLQEAMKSIKAEFGVDSLAALEKKKTAEEESSKETEKTLIGKFQTLSGAYQW